LRILPVKLLATLGKNYGRGYGKEMEISYYVDVYTQPVRNRIAGWLYHKYDMAIYRIPGYSRLERLLMERHDLKCQGCFIGEVWRRGGGAAEELFCGYMPLTARQDIKCFKISSKNRIDVGRMLITEEQYQQLGG